MTKRNKVAKAFNSFFRLIINSLDIFKYHHLPSNAINKIRVIISHFSNNTSILKVKLKFWINREFYFKIVSMATAENVGKRKQQLQKSQLAYWKGLRSVF